MSCTVFCSPTKVYFGKDTHLKVGEVIKGYGARKVLIHYGSRSAIKSGLLACVEKSLKEQSIEFLELGGVVANPRLSLARKGIALCKENGVDMILAVGGGSVLDSAKCIAHGAANDCDVWDFYSGKPVTKTTPFGAILTLAATGSDLSDSSVMTNDEVTPYDKVGCNTNFNRPLFAILNPELTYSVSKYQTGSGSADIMMHTLERYFNNGTEMDFTDKLAFTLLRTVIDSTVVALEKPDDYNARADLLWANSLSHNNLMEVGYGSHGDWSCHRLEHELSALYDVAHGAGLAAIWGSWARFVCDADYSRFAKLGKYLFGIEESDDKTAAEKTITSMEGVFRSFGMPVNLKQLGLDLNDDDLLLLAKRASKNGARTLGCFKVLNTDDMYGIYRAANN